MKEVYQALSGALGQDMRLTQIANNLANVNTVGFKKDSAAFTKYLADALGAQIVNAAPGEQTSSANSAQPVWPTLGTAYTDFREGTLQPTGRPLDVAIEKDGFFQVQVQGEPEPLYTRAGSFRVSQNNELVTADGHRVLGQTGSPITVDLRDGNPDISADGNIRLKNSTVGQLGVVQFAEPNRLVKYGAGLFRAPQGVTPQQVEQPRLRQGMLENSNVNVIEEMVNMITLQRSHEVLGKIVQTIDEITSKRIDAARG